MINKMKEELDKEELEMIKESNKTNSIYEKSENMLFDVDKMIKEIQSMRQKIKDIKIKEEIQTKDDYLKLMNDIIPNNNNNSFSNATTVNSECKDVNKNNNLLLLENDFKINEEKINNYKNYIIPKDEERNNNFNNIKEKLKNQENEIQQVKNQQVNRKKPKKKLRKKQNNDLLTGDSNIDKLFEEINMVNSRMDNYLKDIDECLEMNEKINRKLDSNSNHSNSISNNEEEKNSI
jgi:hypothetical protein